MANTEPNEWGYHQELILEPFLVNAYNLHEMASYSDNQSPKKQFQTKAVSDEQSFQNDYEENQQRLNPNEEQRYEYSKGQQLEDCAHTFGRKQQIILTSISTKMKRRQCIKGERYQTKNICKQLFTETSNFLKMMMKANEITKDEESFVVNFLSKKKVISLQSFNQLFTQQQLRQKCLQFYQSKDFITRILNSRANLKSKLILIKYLETIRRTPIKKETIKWKHWKG